MNHKYNYTYDILLDPKLDDKKKLTIANKIKNVLNDSRGWKQFGYKFTFNKDKSDMIITLAKNEKIKEICNFDGLSCADLNNNVIYLNLENWIHGIQKSKLSLNDYRTYMICHEVGHILGKGHIKLSKLQSGSKVPVMVQQTLGIGNCKPNCWPLSWENTNKELI